jgi:hypothetical protein
VLDDQKKVEVEVFKQWVEKWVKGMYLKELNNRSLEVMHLIMDYREFGPEVEDVVRRYEGVFVLMCWLIRLLARNMACSLSDTKG